MEQSKKSEAVKPQVIDELIKFQEASGALKSLERGTIHQVLSCRSDQHYVDQHDNYRDRYYDEEKERWVDGGHVDSHTATCEKNED